MAATRADIQRWIDQRPASCTHMLVVCDTYDWEDYPVYYPDDYYWAKHDADTEIEVTVQDVYQHYHGQNMQKVMEVYSFTGKHSIEEQMKERRAHHYD